MVHGFAAAVAEQQTGEHLPLSADSIVRVCKCTIATEEKGSRQTDKKTEYAC